MRQLLSLSMLLAFTTAISQEMEDNLYPTLKSSSLHLFHKSEKSKMIVESHRHSPDHGMVVETTSTYRKGKINPLRINFSIKYSEYYVLSDNKKSLGKYELGEDDQVVHYQRSDFNTRNIRKWAYEYDYTYSNNIVTKEKIVTIEYLNEASVEADTAEYWETFNYDIEQDGDVYNQHPHKDKSVYTKFVVTNGMLISKTNHFDGFDERYDYAYNDKNQLTRITNSLNGQDGNSIETHTDLTYTPDGLIKEAKFYNEGNSLLEKRVFTYK